MFLADSKGFVFSTDLLLTLFLIILIIGIVANIIDSSNEKIINPLEVAELERISSEAVDVLINNPGTPNNWEELSDFSGVRPGLAIQNENEESLINTISFKKIKTLENSEYDNLISSKIFNNRIKSSIAIYPINPNLNPIIVGDEINSSSGNISNIVVINRTVKCDYYSDLAIVSIFNKDIFSVLNKNNIINGLKGYNNFNEKDSENIFCNHETIDNRIHHSNSGNYEWICKEFTVSKQDLDKNNYYLIFNDESVNNDNYYILDNVENILNNEENINNEKINLNSYFENSLTNKNSITFYLHCKINKNKFDDFNCVLVNVPKEIDVNNLNIDYFTEQDCDFIMKTSYA